MRKYHDGIDAAIDPNYRTAVRRTHNNTKVRLIIRRVYGFHSPEAALTAVMLACGPVNLELPYHASFPTRRIREPL